MKSFLPILLLITTGTLSAQPIVIAHRGASGYLPEHTLPAKALAYGQGADYLEQDLVLSKDKVPIVLHDVQIDTVTDVATRFPDRKRDDGRYYAIDFTLAELKELRATERLNLKTGEQANPNRFPAGASRFELTTLEEELQFIQGLNHSTGKQVGIYPELKRPQWHRDQGYDLSAVVIPILHKYGYKTKEDLCWVQCFEWDEVQRVRKELNWEGNLLLLAGGSLKEDLSEVAKVADGIGPSFAAIVTGKTPAERQITSLVADAHKLGLKVHPYTVRNDNLPSYVTTTEDLLDILINQAQIDGFFTDFPDTAVQWLKAR